MKINLEKFILPKRIYKLRKDHEDINLVDGQYETANKIMTNLLSKLNEIKKERIVIGISGGSGSGKSGLAQIINYYFNSNNVTSFVISGDNYPLRIPVNNDEERIRFYRQSAILNLINNDLYDDDTIDDIIVNQNNNEDLNDKINGQKSWFNCYYEGAKKGLESYLGTSNEQDFDALNQTVNSFKNKEKMWVKKLGTTSSSLKYEQVESKEIDVLIVEWTHVFNPKVIDRDINILLFSTPKETLERRLIRNRGTDQIDTPLIDLVLNIEQTKINNEAIVADIIVDNAQNIIDFETLKKIISKEL